MLSDAFFPSSDCLHHGLFKSFTLNSKLDLSLHYYITLFGFWNPSFNELITDTRYSMKLWFAVLFLLGESLCWWCVSKKKLGNEIIFCCFPNLKQDGKTLYFWNFYVEENICWQLTSTLFGLIRKCSRLNLPKNTCSNNDLTEGDSLEIQNIPFLASLAFLLVFLTMEDGILFSVFLTNNILTWTKPTIIEQSMMISLKSIKCN